MQCDYVSKTLEKCIIKIPSINLSYSKEFETLLPGPKMACSNIITCTAKQCFSKITWNSDFIWMSYRCTYIITGWLPGDSGPNSSHVARLVDNN